MARRGREIGGWEEYELCDHTSNVSISPTSEEINREAAHNVDLAVVTAVIQIADSHHRETAEVGMEASMEASTEASMEASMGAETTMEPAGGPFDVLHMRT
ncbi:hypothetical protein HZH68_016183 [Vespula germanica]|uniref:Uncharacterized protein n=1 Tax=Vespula germanica TaxID=30212 RepID=A0A834J476_VESGE|nr:hypothetical protein HZH68_016183 [Vespula germanica]